MARRIIWAVLVALAVAVPASGAPDAGPAQTAPGVIRANVPGRFDAGVAAIAQARRASGTAAAVRAAREHRLDVSGNSVELVVTARPGRTTDAVEAILDAGGTVVRRYDRLVKALVPVAALETVGSSPATQFVSEPRRLTPLGTPGQGIAATRASLSLPPGVNGTGVKVAIVDEGFQGLASLQASGDLPAEVTTKNYCDSGPIENGQPHGAGVAEIVHELAPGAELYLICVLDEVDLGAAKDYVVANGIKLVNFSVGFYNTSRGDGLGEASTPEGIVSLARASGVLWVNSAGNEARSHWSGSFADGGGGLNAFAPGDTRIGFTVSAPGRFVCLFLKWDAWPTTQTQDFDLDVYGPDGLAVAASHATQNPDNLPPREETCFTSAVAGVFGASIRRVSGAAPRLDLFVHNANFDEYRTAAGSLLEPATSSNALAVGALCVHDGSLEPYSSQGPTIDGRTKPDLVSFDAVSSVTFGVSSSCANGFRGTSASSPHVVGIAALLLQSDPTLGTPAALQAKLESLSLDLGGPGKDNLYGSGKVLLPLPAANGLLVAGETKPSGADIYTISPNGSNRAVIAFDAALPAWAGDGGSVVLARTTPGPPVWSVRPDGTSLAPLGSLTAGDSYPTPSPDGTRLAFVRSGALWVGAADGSGATQVAPGTLVRNPAWSPDGATIAFDDSGNVFTVAAGGGAVTGLFGTADPESQPAWSPDGTKLAFVRNNGILVGQANGSAATPLANTTDGTHPAWSPDGTKLVFVRNGNIHLVNADGTVPTGSQLTADNSTEWVKWQAVVPPSIVSRPSVSGSVGVGSTLAGALGGWRGTFPVSFTRQWLRCDGAGAVCTAIPGATGSTYTQTASDAGSSLRFAVTATNVVRSLTSTSQFTSALAGSPPPPGGGGGGGGGEAAAGAARAPTSRSTASCSPPLPPSAPS